MLDEDSSKVSRGLKGAWIKGSDEDEIFSGEFLREGDGCYLSMVLRHAGAFGNKLVRCEKRIWGGNDIAGKHDPL